MNAPLVSCPLPVIRFGWVCCCTHPRRMTGNGQLRRGAFKIDDCLRNPHFSIPHLKGLDRYLRYEIRICQRPIIKSQCQCQYGNLCYDSDFKSSRAASVGKKSDKKVGFVRFLLLNRLCMVEVTLLGHELQGQSWYTS